VTHPSAPALFMASARQQSTKRTEAPMRAERDYPLPSLLGKINVSPSLAAKGRHGLVAVQADIQLDARRDSSAPNVNIPGCHLCPSP
jgi:hypothetical protein